MSNEFDPGEFNWRWGYYQAMPIVHDGTDNVVLVRGARARGDIPLVPLSNIGGMRLFGPDKLWWLGQKAAPSLAVELLTEDPFEGVNTTPSRDGSGLYRRHIEYLCSKKVLKKTVWSRVKEVCRYTAVLKQTTPTLMSRAIFDLRRTNERASLRSVRFGVHTGGRLVSLLRTIGNARSKKFMCLHADVRNCYYQIPIGDELAHACAVMIGDSVYVPSVLPMGYTKACGISQALIWDIVLHEESEGSLGVSEEDALLKWAPPFIALEGGGFIVLVYDSIFIITFEADIPLWKMRLERNFKEANVELKYLTVEPSKCDFVFCGVRIKIDDAGLWWSVDSSGVSDWKVVAATLSRRTPRNMYTLIGILRFVADILVHPRRRMAKYALMQRALGHISNWDEEIVAGECIAELISDVMNITDTEWKHHLSHVQRASKILWLMADATETLFAVWRMSGGQVVHRLNGKLPRKMRIGDAELLALREALQWASDMMADAVVVGCDNVEAGRAVDNGYGDGKEIENILSQIDFEGVIVIADTESKNNISDVGTRPDQRYSESDLKFRTEKSWEGLQLAWDRFVLTTATYAPRQRTSSSTAELDNDVAEDDEAEE